MRSLLALLLLATTAHAGMMKFSPPGGSGSGDIESVTAGTGMSGGGTSGAVTLNALGDSSGVLNCSLAASVGSSALTVALKDAAGSDASASSPCVISFRSATAATGTYAQVSVTAALSVVVSNGSALGCTVSSACSVYVYAINNAGTVVLGVVGRKQFDEGTVQSSTAEGGAGAADSIGVMYTTAAQTSKAVRLLGRVTITPAASFAWTNAPAEISNVPFVQPVVNASAIRKGTANNFACGGFANKIAFTSSDAVSGTYLTNNQLGTANGLTALKAGLHLISITATSIDSPGSMLQLSYALNAASAVDVIAVSGRDGTSRVVAHANMVMSLAANDVVYFYCNGPNVDTVIATITELSPY